ncbi:tripartite ATP-independent transporter DctM subunit [Rhodothalassium salexigens DSM 2132]|uniref:TRAP transporter large permease protein n=1 Tax=Rhodothalassium salexigens DSM 2132 TaxID=1188247 RepID=A0A4R2PHA4_RHOSA|nr:TRAP transporter large permease subunit [Rhodothalassium salexigens]MBB4211794.1 tripartite ATP-independent transporter DctM subunit [Rhodothalassium salexigens DSM 2132]MBK1638129.1 C4-dicarboxylate ABC transporter permease [Rhodothalassium salexigens DSM 2132]TCP33908.1 tripartite ATP-independent transporter DctM subunit [Rhodothalassium salexigens DSM 2132]
MAGLWGLLALFALLAAGLWVGLALIATGLGALALFKSVPPVTVLAFNIWTGLADAGLAPLPLFILMGELLFRGRVAERLFYALGPFTTWVPGRLLHVNVLSCALFAAACGSSAATTATVGRITVRELLDRGYDRRLVLGSLCGAGTLGFLIPPSIVLILYGVLAEVSIVDLFLAGMVPGALLALAFMAYLAVAGRRAPPPTTDRDAGHGPGGLTRGRALLDLLPVAALIAAVLGSLYAGLATPSESAVIGVAGAAVLAALDGSLSRAMLAEALRGAVRTVAMLGLILAGAFFLSRVAAYLGLPQAAAATLAGLDLPPTVLIAALVVLFIGLGMVLDGLSVIVMTLPFTAPLVAAAGFDALWFGVFLVIMVEMAQITPPVGFNLYVVQSLTGEPLSRVAWASLPFFAIMAAMIVVLVLVPALATALPAAL